MSNDQTEKPAFILARFSDAMQAEVAKSTIEEMLASADEEVAKLLSAQGGIAEMADVTRIYARYGFKNDAGWKNEDGLNASGQDIIWAMPEGMFANDAEILLMALGAQFVAVEPDIEPAFWPNGPHPEEYLRLTGEIDWIDSDEEELQLPALPEKKILH